MSEIFFFIIFIVFIIGMLFLDLGVFHKDNHVVSLKEALIWSCIWISISLLFALFLLYNAELIHGISNMQELLDYKAKYAERLNIDTLKSYSENLMIFRKNLSLEFLTGYLIEKVLSLDNIFVIFLIFSSFQVNPKYYHRVLFYGIIGAVVLRFIFILLSSTIIQHFHPILLIFGLFLIYSGIKIFFEKKEKKIDVKTHPIVRFFKKLHLSTNHYSGKSFCVKENGRWLFTPLFVVLIVIEFSDVIFALDSIPAIFSVTQDPYLVFFSNIFAILGLRALFFVLQSVVSKFSFLKYGIAMLLSFVGIKMSFPFIPKINIEISTTFSLWTILIILVSSIIVSIIINKKNKI